MKKILLIGLLLFTGCEVKYNLEFYDDNLREEIKVVVPKKEKDKISVEWALDFVNVPIGVASYNVINKDILDKLPTEQDINMYIDINNEKY